MSVPHEELGFLNQQLAAMLRQGLPLEGALREICQHMGQTELKQELQKLEADLAKGIPLTQALPIRRLPEFYVQTVLAGVKGNDLPSVLTLLADYYGHVASIWIRLKGLMVYPALVLLVSLLFTGWVAFLQHPVLTSAPMTLAVEFVSPLTGASAPVSKDNSPGGPKYQSNAQLSNPSASLIPPVLRIDPGDQVKFHTVYFWLPPVFILAVVALGSVLLAFRRTRHAMRWRVPAFKEASLAQFASGMHVLLRSGSTMHAALGFLLPIERGTPAGREIERWRKCLEMGNGKFPALAQGSRVFPPLFLWLASSGGDDLAAGFERAAEVYRERSTYRTELLLNATLPASMIVLGIMVALQIYPLASQALATMHRMYTFGPL